MTGREGYTDTSGDSSLGRGKVNFFRQERDPLNVMPWGVTVRSYFWHLNMAQKATILSLNLRDCEVKRREEKHKNFMKCTFFLTYCCSWFNDGNKPANVFKGCLGKLALNCFWPCFSVGPLHMPLSPLNINRCKPPTPSLKAFTNSSNQLLRCSENHLRIVSFCFCSQRLFKELHRLATSVGRVE